MSQLILAIDRDTASQACYRRSLEPVGYGVVECDSGEMALKLLRIMHPDLVILDPATDERGGSPLLREIKNLQPETPLVLCTDALAYRDDFHSWLADAFVTKDERPAALLATIREIL